MFLYDIQFFLFFFVMCFRLFLNPVKFLLVAFEIWTPVRIRTPDNNWDLEYESLESRIYNVQDCPRVLSICQN